MVSACTHSVAVDIAFIGIATKPRIITLGNPITGNSGESVTVPNHINITGLSQIRVQI
jgi:hypothetical protein